MIKFILKRDGRKQKYDRQKVAMAIWKSLFAVRHASEKFAKLLTGGEKFRKLHRKLSVDAAELAVSEVELDKRSPEWKEAARLSKIVEQLLIKSNGSHRWKVEEIQDVVEQVLLAAGHQDAARAYIFYRNRQAAQRGYRLQVTGYRLKEARLGMSENAYAAMAKRYLWKDKDGNVIETPKGAMVRVATAVAIDQNNSKKARPALGGPGLSKRHWRGKYLEIMTSLEFVPAGCYFRGAGNKQNGSLANCFVLPVEDSIAKIFDAVKWSALIHAAGGGTGFNFSHLRPRGDLVKGGGLASGPINFMKAFDAETQIVMQGGEHRGANMGILNVDHPDIFEFIRAKSVDGEVANFNISVGAFDKFMKAVERGRDWPLTNPRDKSTVQKIPARQLWQEIISLAHKTGDPGMIYLDTINKFNPMIKKWRIDATNVCGEQPLFPFDVCNLGSINLSKFVTQSWWEDSAWREARGAKRDKYLPPATSYPLRANNINWSRLEEVVRIAVRFLDDGIDASTYPIPQIEEMAHKLRRIGLGVMGWADMLAKLGVRYDSDEGVNLAEKIMKFIQQISWDESEKLAVTKANFPLWEESYFNSKNNPFGKIRKVRNAAVTTIAPTGTISMIADCSSGIEPYFALEYTKNVVEKQGLKYTNKYYEEASRALSENSENQRAGKSGFLKFRSSDFSDTLSVPSFLKSIFRTAHEISPDWHVKMQAAFQKYTDNAVSKTINFSRQASAKDIERAYLLAWKLGCKGITVYRDGSREGQILKQMTNDELRMTNEKSKIIQHSLPAAATPQALQAGAFNIQHSHSQRLMQSQMEVTPLSQRAYQYERRQIVEDMVDGHCPDCGGVLESTEGCELCRNCGYSRCSI